MKFWTRLRPRPLDRENSACGLRQFAFALRDAPFRPRRVPQNFIGPLPGTCGVWENLKPYAFAFPEAPASREQRPRVTMRGRESVNPSLACACEAKAHMGGCMDRKNRGQCGMLARRCEPGCRKKYPRFCQLVEPRPKQRLCSAGSASKPSTTKKGPGTSGAC
jgi:hypothetical protein